jgi:signal transduction histidine kinase
VSVAIVVAALLVAALLHGRWVARRMRERAARIAHEVRGPLSAAQLALHGAARRGEVTPAFVAALELELRRAALALEDPSGGGRVAAGDDAAAVDLVALLRCQERTWREVAEARGASVRLAPGPDAALVRADALRLAQATSNVVANAIEHGGGVVEIRTRAVGDRVRVEVSDGGPGLPATVAELARRPRAGRGTRGRGLAIAADVLGRFGGRIHALPAARGGRVAIDLPVLEVRP